MTNNQRLTYSNEGKVSKVFLLKGSDSKFKLVYDTSWKLEQYFPQYQFLDYSKQE